LINYLSLLQPLLQNALKVRTYAAWYVRYAHHATILEARKGSGVAARITDGHRSPHAFLRSLKIVAVEERHITSTASRSSRAPFNFRSFEISAVGKGPSGRSGVFLTPSPPGEKATARQDQPRFERHTT